MTKKERSVLEIVRCDLSLAIKMIPTLWIYASEYDDPVKRRLRHGIEMITDVLEDAENWKKLQERWKQEDV